MKHVLFLTNYPSPYRVHFFDELGKYMDVTVLFSDPVEKIKHRNVSWFEEGEHGFQTVQLKPAVSFGGKYKIIDFPLSNCINSSISLLKVNQHVLGQYLC